MADIKVTKENAELVGVQLLSEIRNELANLNKQLLHLQLLTAEIYRKTSGDNEPIKIVPPQTKQGA